MFAMPINEIIRSERKKLGLTQEQIAEYLGVSTPAVNKWEKGVTYPDITILPALARLLRVDLNTLLCFEQELSQTEIGIVLKEISDEIESRGFQAGIAKAKEKVCMYPTSGVLLQSLAVMLQGMMMIKTPNESERKLCDAYILSLYERVLSCGDEESVAKAKFMLASRKIQDGDYERAQELLDTMPKNSELDKDLLQANLFIEQGKDKEAAVILERKIQKNMQNNLIILDRLTQIAHREGNEDAADELADCNIKLTELFHLWDYSGYVVRFELATQRKDKKETISTLKKMLSAFETPWDMTKSVICNHLPEREQRGDYVQNMKGAILENLEKSEEFDFLRGEKEFIEIIGKLKS